MTWTEDDRPVFAERIADGMIAEMTLEEMRQACWDILYEDLIYNEWADLLMHAEQYAPELLTDG